MALATASSSLKPSSMKPSSAGRLTSPTSLKPPPVPFVATDTPLEVVPPLVLATALWVPIMLAKTVLSCRPGPLDPSHILCHVTLLGYQNSGYMLFLRLTSRLTMLSGVCAYRSSQRLCLRFCEYVTQHTTLHDITSIRLAIYTYLILMWVIYTTDQAPRVHANQRRPPTDLSKPAISVTSSNSSNLPPCATRQLTLLLHPVYRVALVVYFIQDHTILAAFVQDCCKACKE